MTDTRYTRMAPWSLFVLLALAYLLTLGQQPFILDFALKALPIWLLAWLVFSGREQARHRWVVVGLLCSSVGDLLLAWGQFVPGLVSFLVAHLFYIAAFAGRPVGSLPRLLLALLMLAAITLLLIRLLPLLGEMQVPVVAYMVVILLMALCALLGRGNHPLVALGAMLFLLSDSLIALDRFMQPLPSASLWIMLTYYSAQGLIAGGALIGPRQGA
ncbi:lysoplasmalogenase [Aestuariirhabdus litorea]|uniref:lysoplasmalogenase n=1 Tax=Aestuariirhabdus litorea TaxID=2528527 RepID=UPI0013E2C1E9|nr:lysoplasmalogenase [Aestuariirhabdus litorea]